MQAASPNGAEDAGVAALELVPLHADTAASSEQSAMMVKLTDESIAAIRKAQRSCLPIKMRMDPQVISEFSFIYSRRTFNLFLSFSCALEEIEIFQRLNEVISICTVQFFFHL